MYIGYCVLEMEMMSFKQKIHEISATIHRIANFPHTREERELDLILSSCVENFLEFSLVTFSVPPPLSLGDISFALFVMSWGLF